MEAIRQLRVADEFVRAFAASIRSAQLYSPTHPLVRRSLNALAESVMEVLADQSSIAIGIIGDEIVVGDIPLPRTAEMMAELLRRLRAIGIERVAFDRGVTPGELSTLALTIANPAWQPGRTGPGVEAGDPWAALATLPHVHVGRIQLDERVTSSAADVATLRRLYSEATEGAETVWDTAQHEGRPDPGAARTLVDSLAQAVSQNRTALIALAALKHYDNYTFTHMVNVSILTMAQAKALGVDGGTLRELGLAALMHDIGKVRTPPEVLKKTDRLTDDEMAIMRMHVVDGAEILRQTPEVPPIAPVVAFEHHLRLDRSGYPAGVTRGGLNLGTMLCSIADVYDAMRSQRAYQQAFPSDRILAVLQRSDGQQFDQHLVRRFSQLLGIYPPGCLVRLTSGAQAVVLSVHAPDPFKPRVRVITTATGERLETPHDLSLWETAADSAAAVAVETPLDPAAHGVDPLSYL